jgi:transcription elongation factor GreA
MNTTINEKTVLLSKKGLKELKKSIAQLKHDQHKVLQYLHENDKGFTREDRLARIEKLSQLEAIEAELADKNLTIENSKLIPRKSTRFQVAIGSVVDLIDKSGRLFRYTIVDSIEANPSDGRISILSPLGRSLIGKTIHDIIEWGNGNRSNQLQLIRII